MAEIRWQRIRESARAALKKFSSNYMYKWTNNTAYNIFFMYCAIHYVCYVYVMYVCNVMFVTLR